MGFKYNCKYKYEYNKYSSPPEAKAVDEPGAEVYTQCTIDQAFYPFTPNSLTSLCNNLDYVPPSQKAYTLA